jgi:ABC-type amino acid transport substrate-binding protein
MINDKILLETYMLGFSDELEGETREFEDSMLMRAYELGRIDAFVGDDVRSIDYQSDEHLLKRIYQEYD